MMMPYHSRNALRAVMSSFVIYGRIGEDVLYAVDPDSPESNDIEIDPESIDLMVRLGWYVKSESNGYATYRPTMSVRVVPSHR